MDVKHLYRLNKRINYIKPSYLLVLTIFFSTLSVYALRHNNFEMIRLRDAVVTADQQNGDVETALQNLRKHVYGHMNTNLSSGKFAIKPPIQLKARYDRLTAGEVERVKQANAQATIEGENICGAQFPAGGFNAPRVACLQDYVAAHAGKTSTVPESLYKFDFVSPRWSPDLAGWSLVLASVSGMLFLLRIVIGRLLRNELS